METSEEEFPQPVFQKSSRRPTEELKEMDEGYGSMPTIKDGEIPAASPTQEDSVLSTVAETIKDMSTTPIAVENSRAASLSLKARSVAPDEKMTGTDRIATIDDDEYHIVKKTYVSYETKALDDIQEEDEEEDDDGSIIAPLPIRSYSASYDSFLGAHRAPSPINRTHFKSLKLDEAFKKQWTVSEEEEPEDDETTFKSNGPSRLRKWKPVNDLKQACDAEEAQVSEKLAKVSITPSNPTGKVNVSFSDSESISSDQDLDLSSYKAKKLYTEASTSSVTGVLDFCMPSISTPVQQRQPANPITAPGKAMRLLDGTSLKLKLEALTKNNAAPNTTSFASYPGLSYSPTVAPKVPVSESIPGSLGSTLYEADNKTASNETINVRKEAHKSRITWSRAKELLHPIWKRSQKEKQKVEVKDVESESLDENEKSNPIPETLPSIEKVDKRESPGILRRLLSIKEKRNAVGPVKLKVDPSTISKPIEQPVIVDPPEIAAKKPGVKPSMDLDDDDDLLLDYHSRKEKVRFKNSYKVMKNIGSGGHSTVRLARRVSDDALVVCKFIHASSVWHWHLEQDPPADHSSSTQKKPSTQQHKIPLEIYMMRAFQNQPSPHPSMIQYFEHYEIGSRFVIVMEYLGEDWMDLYDYIEYFGPVKEDHATEIFYQIVQVVDYIHRHGFCHNDIKDENIMINTKTRKIKLIDLGSTTPLPRGIPTTIFYGTKKFAAPEAVQGFPYYQECQEVWALGTLLYVLLFKMDPFKNDEEVCNLDIGGRIQRLLNAQYGDSLPNFQLSDAAVEALVRTMEKEWQKRPGLSEILEMKLFKPLK